MSQAAELAGALQRDLAPVLYETAISLAAGLDRHANAGEIAGLPNIELLLQAMAGQRVVAGGRMINFGEGN
jgi:hypothetical protein